MQLVAGPQLNSVFGPAVGLGEGVVLLDEFEETFVPVIHLVKVEEDGADCGGRSGNLNRGVDGWHDARWREGVLNREIFF